MEYKKVVEALDGTYCEGTSQSLCNTIYRYDQDFSDQVIADVIDFAQAVKDIRTVKILRWLLESRNEQKENKINLGQMKIDAFLGQCIECDTLDEEYTCEIMLDCGNVVITMNWYDEDERDYATAAGLFTLEEFLNFDDNSFSASLGEIRAYGRVA